MSGKNHRFTAHIIFTSVVDTEYASDENRDRSQNDTYGFLKCNKHIVPPYIFLSSGSYNAK